MNETEKQIIATIDKIRPFINLFVISLRKTPDLVTGSRKVVSFEWNNSWGNKSSILLTNSGDVKTSSLLKLARQDKTSGL